MNIANDQVEAAKKLSDEKLRHVIGGLAVSDEQIEELFDDLEGGSEDEELVGKRGPGATRKKQGPIFL